ncbi:MAG: FecR family protein [Deltaproteobacteria bacterium]|nr:FecR family protein [Deltaproteobacteria bacterium]
MKSIFTALAVVIMGSNLIYAAEKAGTITRYKGTVRVYKEGAVRGEKVKKKGYEVFVKDMIKTKRRALAYIDMEDNSKIILKGNSIMEIDAVKDLNLKEGRVLFRIKKQDRMRGLRVKTKSIVIGVKGTEFLVDSGDEFLKLYLKEGRLNVESPEGEFKRYKKRDKEAFEDFKKNKIEEFEEYKKELEEEFVEYVKEFEMEGGTAIVIRGSEVRDTALSAEIEEEFALFEPAGEN